MNIEWKENKSFTGKSGDLLLARRSQETSPNGGQKLKMLQKCNPNYSATPVIGSAVNTSLLTQNKTTVYMGNLICENGYLKRILFDGGYYENGYHFYIKGHLGDNYAVVNSSGAIVQKTQYYPFGMSFSDGLSPSLQPYKYNDKELDIMHGLNQYDYSARQQDPVIGRFLTIDPLAEMYYSVSPYAYCANNPIRFIDPDGRSWKDKVAGVVLGVVTNIAPGTTGARDWYSPDDASDYNNTLRGVDNAAMAFGGSMIEQGGKAVAFGGTVALAGASVSVASGGTLAIGGVPATVVGGALAGAGVATAAGGAVVMANSANNQAQGYNYGDKSSGRGSNHLKPDSNAQGDHSTFKKSSDGTTTNTATYKQNPQNPSGFDEVKRVDVQGGAHKNKSGQNVATPHVHEKGQEVRPARPDELPKK